MKLTEPEKLTEPKMMMSCMDCGAEMQPKLFQVRCERCQPQFDAAVRAAAFEEWQKARRIKWSALLAYFGAGSFVEHPQYQLLQSAEAIAAGARWTEQYLPSAKMGLGLIGPPGAGKTVTAGMCLRKAYMAGHSCGITSDPRLATMANELLIAGESRVKAQHEYERLSSCGFLLIDDIGQSCRAGAARELLLKLVHERRMNGLPILWTAQSGANWIAARLGCAVDEDGEAVLSEEVAAFLRRLWSKFCLVMDISKQSGNSPANPL